MIKIILEIITIAIIGGSIFYAGLLQGESQMKRYMEKEHRNG